eukprot:255665_1
MALELIDTLIARLREEGLNFFGELPDDIIQYINLCFLDYSDQMNFTLCSKYLYWHYGSYLYKYYCCGNCEAPLFHPQAIEFTKWSELNPSMTDGIDTDRDIKTDDGEAVILRYDENDAHLLPTLHGVKRMKLNTIRSHFEVSTQSQLCFDMFVANGLREYFEEFEDSMSFRILVMLLGPQQFHQMKSQQLQVMAHSIVCNQCKLFLGFKINDVRNLNDKTLSINFRQNVLNRLMICKKYTRLVSFNNTRDPSRNAINCTGIRGKLQAQCGNILTYADQMLSDEHCWTIDNKRENASFYNSVCKGSVNHRNMKMIPCAQGDMMCSVVFCSKCDAEIGWRFELYQTQSESHCNQNQYGRYGLVHSSITQSAILL